VNAEQIRLGVRQLKASQILGEATLAETTIKPADDPFPAAIVVVGNLDHDIRQSGYEVTHGMMNQENIYETAPGSGQYFIIDYVLGDGLGAKQAETGSSSDNSWHSWHASNSNVLIRAKQVPVDVVSSEVAICGCGPQKELQLGKIAADESVSSVKYPVAIFMLPAAALPRYSGDEFKASFDRAKINIRYIPRQGFRCAQVPGPVVC
jgi:hypothetical protein